MTMFSLFTQTGVCNYTATKGESTPDVLSDWSSAGIVLVGVTTDYMRPKRSCDFSRTVSTFSPNLQSPYWHFWHHLLEILNSSQLSGLHKTLADCSTGHISVLNKRHWCQNGAAAGRGYVMPRRALVGDSWKWQLCVLKSLHGRFSLARKGKKKKKPLRSCLLLPLSDDLCLSSQNIFQVKSYI